MPLLKPLDSVILCLRNVIGAFCVKGESREKVRKLDGNK